jgi:hypothetical protein
MTCRQSVHATTRHQSPLSRRKENVSDDIDNDLSFDSAKHSANGEHVHTRPLGARFRRGGEEDIFWVRPYRQGNRSLTVFTDFLGEPRHD